MTRTVHGVLTALLLATTHVGAGYVNYEVSHVHPIDLTPSGSRLLAVNTPDAVLEVFDVEADGSLTASASIPVGLEPVTVVARLDDEAWVVNNLSDSVSIVDLNLGLVTRTLPVGDEPTDVAFAGGKAFVAISSLDRVRVYDLNDLDAAPATVELFGRDVRALAVSNDGAKVYAVVLRSGNGTAVINAGVAHFNVEPAVEGRLLALGLRDIECDGHPGGAPPHPYPPLPTGIQRNPDLPNPPLGGPPKVSLIVKWNGSDWVDEVATVWSDCLQFRPADNDLFVIDVATLGVTEVQELGTSLFEVSVHPGGKIYVPHTDARNFIPSSQHATEGSGRFEHLDGVRRRPVDNGIAIVDPAAGHAVNRVDLNTHIDRSTTPGSLSEREASVSQPGMLAWKSDGSSGYLAAIGSRKVFRVDGQCSTGACIFGPSRATPQVVEVGEGPTGVALLENVPGPGSDRLYVLNRIEHSIAIVDPASLTLLDSLPLHDPSSEATRVGRRFLYDAIDTSGHGDASCASCHVSGDLDGQAWELGNPEDDFVAYDAEMDNVRFITLGGGPCDPESNGNCAVSTGFDPQKGPMTTQSFRGMLEPLHWRGDRPTLRDFNGAFVALMGTANIGTAEQPRGLTPQAMEQLRQFALAINYPPNPFRGVKDDLPDADVQVHGMLLSGNPSDGENTFNFEQTDGGTPCVSCHKHPFGAAGGKLGGVEPAEPTSMDATALFNGGLDLAVPNDLEVPHMRNMYEKYGAVWADTGDDSKPPTTTTFGYIHDGSIPDLYRFLAANVFSVSPAQIRDLVAFMFYFPTSTRPAVGRQVTFQPGPAGAGAAEQLLDDLIDVGDLADLGRHCELVASTIAGDRVRRYHLSGGSWVTDVAGDAPISEASLRENAQGPITFTCVNLTSGARLGGNRDEDVRLDGDDCAPADAETFGVPATLTDLTLMRQPQTSLSWSDQTDSTGPSLRYDVLGGSLADLSSTGFNGVECIGGGLVNPDYVDTRPDPPAGDGHYYVVRAGNPCGEAVGDGREELMLAVCP